MMKIMYLFVMSLIMLVPGGFVHAQEAAVAAERLVIDVRTEQEWKEGHLAGAVLIPHDRIEQGIVAVAPDKKSRMYLYCRTGRRTGLAFDVLKKIGYEDVVNLGAMENASNVLHLPIVK
jgi:phage shock protein E